MILLIKIDGKWREIDGLETFRLRENECARVCARCQKILGVVELTENQEMHITHTYCDKCSDDLMEAMNQDMEENKK